MDEELLEISKRAQERLIAETEGRAGILGIGIGLSADMSSPEIEVLIASPEVSNGLPEQVYGIAVRTKEISEIKAF